MFEHARPRLRSPSRETVHVTLGVAIASFLGLATMLGLWWAAGVATISQNPEWSGTFPEIASFTGQLLAVSVIPALLTAGYYRSHPSVAEFIDSIGDPSAHPRLRTAIRKLAFGVGVTATIAVGTVLAAALVFSSTRVGLSAALPEAPLLTLAAVGALVVIFCPLSILFTLLFLAGYSRRIRPETEVSTQ